MRVEDELDFIRAVEQTRVVRHPRQRLSTFGATTLTYYVVTEPIYRDIQPDPQDKEGVVRTGKVVAEEPAIVTPFYAMNLEGFSSDAYRYLEAMSTRHGPNSPGILYKYRNEPSGTEIVSGDAGDIARRIDERLTGEREDLTVVMIGVDDLWDVSLLKFIYELTANSAPHNVQELDSRGLLDPAPGAGGIPMAAVASIERLFRDVRNGGDPETLRQELDRWGAFDAYQDRFLDLFRRR